MSEPGRRTESAATTIARVVVFALVLAIVLASVESFEMGSWAAVLPAAFFVLGLVADGAIAWLGGARRRAELVRAVGATVMMWLAILAMGWLLGLAMTGGDPDSPSGSVGTQLLFIGIAIAVVALLPRAQAIAAWLLACAGATVLLSNASFAMFYSDPGPYPAYFAAVLAASSIGVLALYVRGAISKRQGWRPLAWRLALVGLAVALSVTVSTFATVYVGESMVAYQSMDVLLLRRTYGARVSQQLSSAYGDSEFASATPDLNRDLILFSSLDNVGLSIYDRATRRVVTSIRQSVSEEDVALAGYRYRPVSIGATETAAIVAAVSSGETEDPARPLVGGLPPLWHPLGFRNGRALPVAALAATAPASYSGQSAISPNGTRFALVVTESRADWTEFPSLGADEVSRAMGLALTPWLFLSFMLPCTLGLLALDRRDAARARLAAVEERARLNRDAHDRVYNRLTALANRLAAAEPADTAVPRAADDIRRTVSDLQAILGDGAGSPLPSSTDAAASLVADVCADQARIWNMDVRLEGAEALHGIDPLLGWELQCIAEEALTNAGKHGPAAHARVRFSREDETISLEVSDDGPGIDRPLGVDGLPDNASGMAGMAKRARAVGGEFSVVSSSLGTMIAVRVPISRAG